MEGGHYAELMAFMAVHEARSFRGALLRLGVTPSALSRTLRRLEDRLAVRLLNRTTRRVSPTEAGRFFTRSSLQPLPVWTNRSEMHWRFSMIRSARFASTCRDWRRN